jgi:hypothetical protein
MDHVRPRSTVDHRGAAESVAARPPEHGAAGAVACQRLPREAKEGDGDTMVPRVPSLETERW